MKITTVRELREHLNAFDGSTDLETALGPYLPGYTPPETPEVPTVLHQLTIEVTRTLTEKATLHWLDLTEDEARTAALLIQTAGVDRAVAEIERVVRPYDDLNPSEYQVVSTVLDGESTFQAGWA